MQSHSVKIKAISVNDVYTICQTLRAGNIVAKGKRGSKRVNAKSPLGLMSLNPFQSFELELNSDEDVKKVKALLGTLVE